MCVQRGKVHVQGTWPASLRSWQSQLRYSSWGENHQDQLKLANELERYYPDDEQVLAFTRWLRCIYRETLHSALTCRAVDASASTAIVSMYMYMYMYLSHAWATSCCPIKQSALTTDAQHGCTKS